MSIFLQADPLPKRLSYEDVMADVERRYLDYKRDPFWQAYEQLKHQLHADALRYSVSPRFVTTKDGVVVAVASSMDWEEDEEITEPGLGPDPAPPVSEGEVAEEPVALRPGEYPQIDSEGMAKTDRCYLCATGRQITRFFRTADDSVIACGRCIYDHLGYDIQEDGLLIPVVSEL